MRENNKNKTSVALDVGTVLALVLRTGTRKRYVVVVDLLSVVVVVVGSSSSSGA